MLDVNHIKTVLRSNQVMVENVKVVHRDFDFYDGANFVLVGVRRAGKSARASAREGHNHERYAREDHQPRWIDQTGEHHSKNRNNSQ